ncbi:MAG: hypothetical protein MI975_16780 [Cytophagales bacterium]|nr:hypothetical protein [Cytophagales bacterium]
MKTNGCFILFLTFVCSYSFAQNERTRSLDGTWEIIFDHENIGREELWYQDTAFDKQAAKRTIEVPGAWELIEMDYEGVAFYRKRFEVPEEWNNRVIRLQFGAVNYLSEVWLNGAVVGFHEGGFTPFEFRVDGMIKTGAPNVLTVRVAGPIILSGKEVDGMKRMETPQWRGGITGGIWQSVNLISSGEVYVADVFIQPNIRDNTAVCRVELDHTGIMGKSIDLEIGVYEVGGNAEPAGRVRQAWTLHPGKNRQSFSVRLPHAKYWSPDNPRLYRARVSVKQEGVLSDRRTDNFGMRELTIKNKDFYLNGERIYIKASFFEGLYPNGIAYPDSEEMARAEIRLAKEAGFNMIRPWRRPPAPMWLDLADEMGILVVGSPALECMRLPLSTPYLPARVENEITQTVLRDRNRACIVQWELFNELHRPVLKQLMRPMAMVARQLDPTRLILDESGGWAYGANMYLPYDFEPTKFNDIHNYPGPFINNKLYDGYLTIGMTGKEKSEAKLFVNTPGRNVVPGLMSFVSELGYGSLPELIENNKLFEARGNPLTPAYRYHRRLAEEQRQVLNESGFGDMYPDIRQFYLDQQKIHGTANKRMIEAVRSNPEVDGYCIHALTAGDWILGAGLLDLWRNPKSYAYEATKAANQPRILSIRTFPRNVYAVKGTTVEITGINEQIPVASSLSIEILSEDGNVVLSKTVDRHWESGISKLLKFDLNTRSFDGTYSVKAKIESKNNRVLAENIFDFDVFTDRELNIPGATVTVLDDRGPFAGYLGSMGIKVEGFSEKTKRSAPVFVAGIKEGAEALFDFIRKGGTAVYIHGAQKDLAIDNGVFPFSAEVHPAKGLWTCIPHLVKEHPVFTGLPSGGMMRDVYENVWPTRTLRDIDGEGIVRAENIVASIAFDWFSEDHKMHYSGPGDSWWGADMVIVSYGKGKCIVSQLRLLENLGKDPVADKIVFNLIEFASGNVK